MAHRYADRVQETTTTTGTGDYTPAGAVAGFRAFSTIPSITSGDTLDCYIEDGTNWETGIYTWDGTALARTTVTDSSNGGAAVSWAAGTKRVSNGLTAYRLNQLSSTDYGTF